MNYSDPFVIPQFTRLEYEDCFSLNDLPCPVKR